MRYFILMGLLLVTSSAAFAGSGQEAIGIECYEKKAAACKGGVCASLNARTDLLCDMEVCTIQCQTKADCPATALGGAKCAALEGKKVCLYSAWDKKYCGGD